MATDISNICILVAVSLFMIIMIALFEDSIVLQSFPPHILNYNYDSLWNITEFDIKDDSWKQTLIRITARQNISHVYKQIEQYSPMTDKMLKNVTFLPNYRNPCWKDHGRIHCVPFFFVAGFSKCGTTDLVAKLILHPDIIKPWKKEMHWFDRRRYANRTTVAMQIDTKRLYKGEDFHQYVMHFDHAAKQIENDVSDNGFHAKVTLDGTPSILWDNRYLFALMSNPVVNPPVLNIHSIKAYIPDAKFVVIVRNPTEALWSAYNFFAKSERKSPDFFHNRVLEAIYTFNKCLYDHKPFLYCLYAKFNDDYMFDRMRSYLFQYHIDIAMWVGIKVHVVTLEDYSRDQVSVMNDIFKFLGLREMSREEIESNEKFDRIRNMNKKDKNISMPNKTRKMIDTFYSAANEKLHRFIAEQNKLMS